MKYFKTYEGYKLGVNGVGSLRNSLAALKRQNINGRYVDPEILAQGIRNEYEAITGEKYEDEVQMSMDNTIADIIGHFKLDGPDFMAAWDKVVKESVNESMIGITTDKSFKPADLQKALDKAKIKGYKMDRLSMTLTALKLDKKYFNDAKKLIDDLGLSVMMAKESVNDAFNNLEKIFGTDQETMDMFQGIEDKGTVKDMIEFIDEFGNEEMLSRYGIKSAAQVKKLAKTIMGESMVNEKDFKPHMMYDPKTGKGYKAEKQEDHDRMDKLGYVHEKPEEVTESYEGNFTDFKYDLEMAIDNMDLSPKSIKSVKKKGKGYEVRLSSYMSDKSTWEKIGDTIGATLISFKPGSINIGIYE
jgi:hypothetical protein